MWKSKGRINLPPFLNAEPLSTQQGGSAFPNIEIESCLLKKGGEIQLEGAICEPPALA